MGAHSQQPPSNPLHGNSQSSQVMDVYAAARAEITPCLVLELTELYHSFLSIRYPVEGSTT